MVCLEQSYQQEQSIHKNTREDLEQTERQKQALREKLEEIQLHVEQAMAKVECSEQYTHKITKEELEQIKCQNKVWRERREEMQATEKIECVENSQRE